MLITSRKQAKSAKAKFFFTGVPCRHGHLSERYTSNGGCVDCIFAQAYSRRNSDRAAYSSKQAEWYQRNREKKIQQSRTWQKENSQAHAAYKAQRRAEKLKATPPWADLEVIKQFYLNCPKGHHVDHIIPLKNPLICGLHVLENLQYLTAVENMQKNNKFTPT